ncbi:MAG TPA: hypothetical protein VFR94_11575 [Nitrososphaeraceae archaeon]|nr:hypothetical protein [Nitrososphaeraceae archaeon]
MNQRTIPIIAVISASLLAWILTTPMVYANHNIINTGHECKEIFEGQGFTHQQANEFCKNPAIIIKGGEHCRDFVEQSGVTKDLAHEICQNFFTHKLNKSN